VSFLPQPYELHRILSEGALADLLDRGIEACDLRARMEALAMTPALYIAQRATAFVLAFAVTIHLVTIIYAIRGGLTAGEILARTHGNRWFLGFYLVFVLAAAIHAPIGLRSILREWARWRDRSLDIAMLAFAGLLLVLGVRAALAVYLA
jgi:fumarate reductase subunit C